MKVKLVAIRDIQANDYGPPNTAVHIGTAIRNFQDQCTGVIQGDPTIRNHPEDFELYELGEYDTETGEMTNAKKQIAAGINFRKQ